MSFFTYSCITYAYGIKEVGSRIARGGVRPTSCKTGQLTHSKGLERMGICIGATKAITPSRVFVLKD
jgi:hypothetical protein